MAGVARHLESVSQPAPRARSFAFLGDLAGGQIPFGRATIRYFGKILRSPIFCIGYLMAGFTAKKQALHDIIAECPALRRV